MFFSYLSVSSIQPCVISYLGEFHCNENRAKYAALNVLFGSMGMILQPVFGFFIVTLECRYLFPDGSFIYAPWRLFMLIGCILSGICYIYIQFLLESPKFLATSNRKVEALSVLQKMYRLNHGNSEKVCLTVI